MADENEVTGDPTPAEATDKKDPKKKTGPGGGRPHGVIGAEPKKTPFENTDAELLWPEIIAKLPEKGHQLHELVVRVVRVEPPPKEQVGKAFETAAIVGDGSRIPGDALIQFVAQYYHLPFPWSQGFAQYEIQWCWRRSGEIFARGNLRLPSRDQIAAAYDAESRMRREPGMGAMPPQMPQPPPPMPQMPSQQGGYFGGQPPQGFGAPPGWGFGQPPQGQFPPQQQQVQQPFDYEAERARIRAEVERQYAPPVVQPPVQQHMPPPPPPPVHVQPTPAFDHEAERAKIRAELERDMEMQRMRDELASLKREQRSGFGAPSGPGGRPGDPRGGDSREQHFQPPQQYQRPTEPQLSPEVQIARIVVQTLSAMGIVPPGNGGGAGQPQRQGVGAPPGPQGVVAQAETGLAALEALTTIFDRTRKVTRRLEGVMGGEDKEPEPPAPEPEPEAEATPSMRTQLVDVGTTWRDGRPVKAPIDPETGDIRYDQQGLLAAGFGNPIIGEGIMDFLGALKTRMMQTPVARAGVGSPPSGGERVQVREVRTEQPQVIQHPQQPEQLPPNGTKATPWSL